MSSTQSDSSTQYDTGGYWALVLAAGEGTRLQALTSRLSASV